MALGIFMTKNNILQRNISLCNDIIHYINHRYYMLAFQIFAICLAIFSVAYIIYLTLPEKKPKVMEERPKVKPMTTSGTSRPGKPIPPTSQNYTSGRTTQQKTTTTSNTQRKTTDDYIPLVYPTYDSSPVTHSTTSNYSSDSNHSSSHSCDTSSSYSSDSGSSCSTD
jgi:hypothetical protein